MDTGAIEDVLDIIVTLVVALDGALELLQWKFTIFSFGVLYQGENALEPTDIQACLSPRPLRAAIAYVL